MRAAIYARYSSDNQQDASIEDQIRLCRERAEKEGWEIVGQYKDHAISGSSMLRSGIQRLIEDALAGRIDVVLAEALDRLSRDQADIAAFYKRMRFADVEIITLSEGTISDLHIGLKGTMNALFLKDLADKTRRGLRGRIEAGKSGGGNSYGYDVVRTFAADGTPMRGDRTINQREANIIRQIFRDYADGKSPRAIAKDLNAKGITGPSGKAWGPSTIHGNPARGTGILNNELYIGRMVWNRLRYIKDPETGKRVSRHNPEHDWITRDVPHLRIIDDEHWQAVKVRQSTVSLGPHTKHSKDGFWDRRRPRYLFSGLIKCGVCGNGFSKISQHHFGCSNARNKGTCSNSRTIRVEDLEATVLVGLQENMMTDDLLKVFCDEYTRHINNLRISQNATRDSDIKRLDQINRDLDRLVDAIIAGVPPERLKDRVAALETEKAELDARVQVSGEAPKPLLHPQMGERYRQAVSDLRSLLANRDTNAEVRQIVRSLIDRIVVHPPEDNGKAALIDIEGALAGILSVCQETTKGHSVSGSDLVQIKLVAGAGFEPATFRL
ncbi:MAG: recombinase family protein [Hoeflea sp.]|nr:recombinase family protein [Rhodobiaceae bacterium]MCC0037136.1 recombinase family protein [Hoeflea sp.]